MHKSTHVSVRDLNNDKLVRKKIYIIFKERELKITLISYDRVFDKIKKKRNFVIFCIIFLIDEITTCSLSIFFLIF